MSASALTHKLSISTALPVEFELHAAPPDLLDFVNTFFVIRSDVAVLEEMMPAYSAQLMVFAEGRARLKAEDGLVFDSQPVTFTAPLMHALPMQVSGPLLTAGASLTPLGWQCLADAPADKINNCMVPASSILDNSVVARLEQLGREFCENPGAPEPIFDAIGELFLTQRCAIRPDHMLFVQRTTRWLSSGLSPSLDEFYQQVPFSPRTAQRLSKRFFGVSPTRLIKRYRAIRAAMLLSNPALPQPLRDEIRNSYFDQAHLIRDIRRYTGRTPTALQDGSIAHETLYPEAHGEGASILRKPPDHA